MWSTEPEELTLIPRLEFADGVSKVSQLLSIYPKDQTTKDQIPFSADTVRLKNYVYLFRELQAAGDLSDGNLGHASVSSNTLKVRCKRYARLISERSATSGQLQSNTTPCSMTSQDTGSDAWGWEVIQAAGAYSDLQTEVERRFAELHLVGKHTVLGRG